MCLFAKTAKFLNLAFKIEKVKTKHKNSALCLSEKLASFYTLRFIHKTVVQHLRKTKYAEYFQEKRKKITDNLLGILTFRKSNRLDESYWNVDRKVNSVNELVEFYIYNNEYGINESQKKLILEIEKNILN